jgi:hypothetical protein
MPRGRLFVAPLRPVPAPPLPHAHTPPHTPSHSPLFFPLSRQLYKRAGLPATAFTGVPLFQAEGLTVKSDATRYTPLFFCKADLDSALRDAYLSKDSEAQAGARAKADRARAEVAVAEEEEEAAAAAGGEGEGRARRAAARRADAARQRLQRYEQRLEEATAKKVRCARRLLRTTAFVALGGLGLGGWGWEWCGVESGGTRAAAVVCWRMIGWMRGWREETCRCHAHGRRAPLPCRPAARRRSCPAWTWGAWRR